MEKTETKAEYVSRAKSFLREDLQAKSWPDKVRAIARMNAVSKAARESMRLALKK